LAISDFIFLERNSRKLSTYSKRHKKLDIYTEISKFETHSNLWGGNSFIALIEIIIKSRFKNCVSTNTYWSYW